MSNNKKRFQLDDEGSENPDHLEFQGGEEAPEEHGDENNYDDDKHRLVDFLRYPREKRKIADFLEDTYKQYEQEAVDRMINRVVHEHDIEHRGATPYHKPGHIGPLMYEYLNMIGVEAAFVSGLQHTKSSMTKTVQNRVDEINTLLRGVGGFNRQIKASFSRSAVVYLEQEDPFNRHREKVIFTVNLGDFELRYRLNESAADQVMEDGRTLRRMVWDEAVNTMAEIVSNTGMKPKYVKNDKNSCIFTMRQALLSANDKEPDEFFTFDLRYVNEENRKKMEDEYVGKIAYYDKHIEACKKQAKAWWQGSKVRAKKEEECITWVKKKDFYVATTADPREMDYGLVFSISVNTLKDYTVTKDKMQVIMTKYILALSKIATDKSMDQQVNTVYQQRQGKARNFQQLEEDLVPVESEEEGGNKKVVVMKDDIIRSRQQQGKKRFRA